jgi:DNA-binding LacI/PurR family transcriptional regulator
MATISRALQGQTSVAPATRERIVALAKELGYRPNKRLQRFFRSVHHQSHVVAFLTAGRSNEEPPRDPFYGRIMSTFSLP